MDSSACTFCGASAGARLIHGPGMTICAGCLQKYLANPETPGAGECSFCGQTANEVQSLHRTSQSQGKAICGYCVQNFADEL